MTKSIDIQNALRFLATALPKGAFLTIEGGADLVHLQATGYVRTQDMADFIANGKFPEFSSKNLSPKPTLELLGDCRNEALINELFGSVTDFAQIVEANGDNCRFDGIQITYDAKTDIHTFYKI